MLFEGILLTCCSSIQNERTTAAIYHLLSGKRSIQTVQDAHIYKLKMFYGVFKPVTKQTFDETMYRLIKQELLTEDFQLTSHGTNFLRNNENKLLFHDFNGIKYHTIASVFSDRLLLLIQTVTNSKKQYFSFIPVIDNPPILNWMKRYYPRVKSNETAYLKAIYEELYRLLSDFPGEEASMFVDRLSGHKQYGQNSHQLSNRYQMNVFDVHLVWVRMIHRILSVVYSDVLSYPVLYSLVRDIEDRIFITNSAHRTYQLLDENFSAQEIAQMRKLKINTIYDHIVEIALFVPSFPIYLYVSEEKQAEIMEAINRTNSTTLKQIKEIVDGEISYFQIRLVLATSTHNATQLR